MPGAKRPLINDALRLVRLYCGYSQADLARELDLSQSMISDIERGAKSVSLDVIERYSDRLAIRPSQLLFFAEELGDEPPRHRGRLVIAGKVLTLLDKLAPKEQTHEEAAP